MKKFKYGESTPYSVSQIHKLRYFRQIFKQEIVVFPKFHVEEGGYRQTLGSLVCTTGQVADGRTGNRSCKTM